MGSLMLFRGKQLEKYHFSKLETFHLHGNVGSELWSMLNIMFLMLT